jgi:putative endonuclease
MFHIYILQSQKSERFYIGHTEDLTKRLLRHNSGQVVATRNKGPWVVVYTENFNTRNEAISREFEIKAKKSRKYIEKLILNNRDK